MLNTKLKAAAEMISTAAVLAVAVLLCVSLFLLYSSGPRLRPGLQIGSPFSEISGLEYHKSPKTLVLVLDTKSSCADCLDFYRHLVSVCDRPGSGVKVVGIFRESIDDVRRFIVNAQLDIATIPRVNLDKVSIPITPALVLINKDGKIIDFWLGSSFDDGEKTRIASAVS
jgi:hypothetical protein